MLFTVFLHSSQVFDEEGGPCMTGTAVGRRGSQRGGGSFFNRLRSSFSSPTGRRSGGKGYKTFENPPPRPSTSAADSGGTADQASNQRATRRRVQHETDVQTGVFHSPHYVYPNQYYPFPRLGRVRMGYNLMSTFGCKRHIQSAVVNRQQRARIFRFGLVV